jgi:hypothetical protein
MDLASLYAAAIGPHNQAHYVAKFRAFDRTSGPYLGWHWPAFFLTVYWLLYRKLWWHALGYFAAPYVLVAMAAMLVPMVGADWAAMVGLGFLALLFVVPALLGDGIYYRRCRQLIEQARTESSDARAQLAYLNKAGGTSKVIAVLFYVLFVPRRVPAGSLGELVPANVNRPADSSAHCGPGANDTAHPSGRSRGLHRSRSRGHRVSWADACRELLVAVRPLDCKRAAADDHG